MIFSQRKKKTKTKEKRKETRQQGKTNSIRWICANNKYEFSMAGKRKRSNAVQADL